MNIYTLQLNVFIAKNLNCHKIYFILKALTLSSVVFSANANASATASDYIPCQKKAVKILSACMEVSAKSNNGRVNDNACWESSKQGYDTCVLQVVKNYSPEERKKRYLQHKQAEKALKLHNKVK